MKGIRKWAAAMTPLLMAGALVTVAAPSSYAAADGAQACTHPAWSNKSSGKGQPSGSVTYLRTGPNKDCGITAEVYSSVMFYHCWVTNSAGNKWTHVRIDGTEINGWVYNPQLDDGGSQAADNRC